MKPIMLLIAALFLSACSNDQEDIAAWMNEQAAGMKGGVKPLPEIRPFPVVNYDSESFVDPFQVSKLEPERKAGGVVRPDPNWRREPLEAYPLESLTMVGLLQKNKVTHALIKVDGAIHQVHVGSHMGQNFGVVTAISDSEVSLKELVEDLNGEWTERTSSLRLQEQEAKQ